MALNTLECNHLKPPHFKWFILFSCNARVCLSVSLWCCCMQYCSCLGYYIAWSQ